VTGMPSTPDGATRAGAAHASGASGASDVSGVSGVAGASDVSHASGAAIPDGGHAVDWAALQAAAAEVRDRAYAPYSHFPVGAAGLVDDGRVVVGCNVENASYGVALCAECGMVSSLHATGGGRLTAVSCVGDDGKPLMPCGRCRQLLWEHGGPTCLLLTPEGVLPMSALLPQAFGPEQLDSAAERADAP
jgi:cytidine deaminase